MCRSIRIKFLLWAYMYTTLKFWGKRNSNKSIQIWHILRKVTKCDIYLCRLHLKQGREIHEVIPLSLSQAKQIWKNLLFHLVHDTPWLKSKSKRGKATILGGSKGRTFWKGNFPILCNLEWFEGPKFLLNIVCKASGTHHNLSTFFCFQNFSSQHSGCNIRLITIISETRQEKHSIKGWVNLADMYHEIKSITFLPHEVGLPHRWSKWP